MKQYKAGNIKNLAVVGHGGSGKTSLTEALLFSTKATQRLGKISDGTTVCDFDTEEISRKASLGLAVAPFEYNGYKVNVLDAPGLFDFVGGMGEAIRAAESVLIVISGKSGLTTGAKNAYKMAKQQGKACAVYIGKLDRESADFYKVLEELKTEFGPSVSPLVVPHYEEQKVQCYVDLMDMKAFTYQGGTPTEVEIPPTEHRLEGLVSAISEAVAETDEELFEKYFSGEKFTQEELVEGIHKGIRNGDVTPVFCGSSTELEAIDLLLDGITKLLPSAQEAAVEGIDGADIKGDKSDEDATVAFVFKTVADPFVGKMSFLKVELGTLKADATVKNMTTGESEKLGKLISVFGKRQEDAKLIPAGDIGVVSKMSAKTGDTLCVGAEKLGAEFKLNPVDFPKPCYNMAIYPLKKGDESKISQSMARLLEEDPTLGYQYNHETHQAILSGLGEQHLDVVLSKLKNKFGIETRLEQPLVAYRETIRKKTKAEGKHKKQSGGHGQFGHVWVEFEPCDGDELVFETKVVGGAVPKGYFPAVEKGLKDSMEKGVVAGYPMVGVKAVLVDGSYHPVDSSEMSFKMAASLAYKAGIPEASPVLLEPIGHLEVLVPDNSTGDMMGELNKRRGRVLGMNPAEDEKGFTIIEAQVPMSEMADFNTLVRQMTQGSGVFTFEFESYEELPGQLKDSVIEKAKKLLEDK